jgi:hypothetical protein
MRDDKVCYTFHRASISLAGGLIGRIMTERMQAYRMRMEKRGLVQVRVWIEKQDEEFVKFIAKFCRDEREKTGKEKKRFGRPANHHQIRIAKAIASVNDLPEPEHLYNYHISLSAWMWRYGGSGLDDSKQKTSG